MSDQRSPFPSSVESERVVLGAMLGQPSTIPDILPKLNPDDFSQAAHALLYELISRRFGSSQATDPAALISSVPSDQVTAFGGPDYLLQLVQAVPASVNVPSHVETINESSLRRRLSGVANELSRLSLEPSENGPADLVASAHTILERATHMHADTGLVPLARSVDESISEVERLEKLREAGTAVAGIPTGFADLDRLTTGFHPGQFIIVAARPAVGKALALDTPLPTPDGGTITMRDTRPGTRLVGAAGQPVTVTGVSDVMNDRDCHTVGFSDRAHIVADSEHLWTVNRNGQTITVTTANLHPGIDQIIGGADDPTRVRVVVSVAPAASVPVKCVQVDAPDKLYLAGPSGIPTHNSTLAMDFARSAAIKHGLPTLFYSLEMSHMELSTRLLSAECRIPLQNLRSGDLTGDEWKRLADRYSNLTTAPLYINDNPEITIPGIRAQATQFKARHGLGLIVVDYLQLVRSAQAAGRRYDSRQVEVSELSRQIKLTSKSVQAPMVVLSQLNRGPEQRSDKKPLLSDLRESGSLEQDADMVILLHREDVYNPETPRAGEADLIIAKHRNGPTDTITVAHQGQFSRFVNAAPEHVSSGF